MMLEEATTMLVSFDGPVESEERIPAEMKR